MEAKNKPVSLEEAQASVTSCEASLEESMNLLRAAVMRALAAANQTQAFMEWAGFRWPALESLLTEQTAGQVFRQLGVPSLLALVKYFSLENHPEIGLHLEQVEDAVRDRRMALEEYNELARQVTAERNTFLNRCLCQTRPVAALDLELADPEPVIAPNTIGPAPRTDLEQPDQPPAQSNVEFIRRERRGSIRRRQRGQGS